MNIPAFRVEVTHSPAFAEDDGSTPPSFPNPPWSWRSSLTALALGRAPGLPVNAGVMAGQVSIYQAKFFPDRVASLQMPFSRFQPSASSFVQQRM
ncbi:MAG: hypothetical protein JRM72_08280 [Nitrososphaerota archaeon]|nr:hypothetical protein [Nitrososphaerota archaeon]